MVQGQGRWISILDYASYRKISISTIRRYIKDGRVKTEVRGGKYFIWIENFQASDLSLQKEDEFLRRENFKLKEELEDLKMLLRVYENERFSQLSTRRNEIKPPEIPMV